MKNNNNTNKASKVGSRVISASLRADVAKRLGKMADTTETPLSAAEGMIVGLNKLGSILASVGTRKGFEDVLITIAPLTDAVELGKQMVRRHQGLIATPAMQADLREIIAWHARCCGAALVGNVYEPAYDSTKRMNEQQTIPGMKDKELKLIAKMEAGMLHRSVSSSTVDSSNSNSTAAPSTRSSGSSGSGPSRTSPKMCSFARERRGVVYFPRVARVSPGAVFVAAARPSVRVDPRAAHLSGSGAIRR